MCGCGVLFRFFCFLGFFSSLFILGFLSLSFWIWLCGEGRVIPGTWRLLQTAFVSPLVICPQIMGRIERTLVFLFLFLFLLLFWGVGGFFWTVLRTSLFSYTSKFCEVEDGIELWGHLRQIDLESPKGIPFFGSNLKKNEEEGIWWLLCTLLCIFRQELSLFCQWKPYPGVSF